MTDPHEDAPPSRETAETRQTAETRAHELQDAVSGLGETPEDALEEIADRNDSLRERLPDDDLSAGGQDPERADEADAPRGEGAPGQG
jgi:hypothetical protein